MKFFIFYCLLFVSTLSFGQPDRLSSSGSNSNNGIGIDFSSKPALKQDIDNMALDVANKLMRCCSKYGGNSLQASVDYPECTWSETSSVITVPMTVQWTGSLSGNRYWIKGKLLINAETKGLTWLKISDSGGFSGGCSNGCVY